MIENYSKEFEKLKEKYQRAGYYLEEEYEGHLRFSKTIEDEEYNILIIAPHDGINFWLLRADPMIYHDRWATAMFQQEFDDFQDLIDNYNHWFWNMAKGEWKAFKEFLEDWL